MIKIINNIWSIIKLSILLLVLVVVMTFVDTDKLITSGMMLLGFYVGFKGVNLLYLFVKKKIECVEDTETVVKEEDKINPEIEYIEGLIKELKKKAKKTVKDKNTLDLLGIKLKQLKNV